MKHVLPRLPILILERGRVPFTPTMPVLPSRATFSLINSALPATKIPTTKGMRDIPCREPFSFHCLSAPRPKASRPCVTRGLTPTARVRTRLVPTRTHRTTAFPEDALCCTSNRAVGHPFALGCRPRKGCALPSGRAGSVIHVRVYSPRARLCVSETAVGAQAIIIPAHLSSMEGRRREHGMRLPRDHEGWDRSRLPGVKLRAEPMMRLHAPRLSIFGSTRITNPTREQERSPPRRDPLLWCTQVCKGLLSKN